MFKLHCLIFGATFLVHYQIWLKCFISKAQTFKNPTEVSMLASEISKRRHNMIFVISLKDNFQAK